MLLPAPRVSSTASVANELPFDDAALSADLRAYRARVRAGAPRQYRCWQEIGKREMEKLRYIIADPRAHDAPEDSDLWCLLMSWALADEIMATGNPHSLYSALHGLRCGLARIQIEGQTARLLPGLWGKDDYERARRDYLVPHREVLQALLQRLGKWAWEKEQREGSRILQEAML